MRVPVYRMAAPIAFIGTSASGNHRDRRFSVMFPPRSHITGDIDLFTVGPRLNIQVRQQGRSVVPDEASIGVAKNDPVYRRPRGRIESARHQLLKRDFRFTRDHNVRPGIEILLNIVRWLRAADKHTPSRGPSRGNRIDHIATRHQVAVDTERGWRRPSG